MINEYSGNCVEWLVWTLKRRSKVKCHRKQGSKHEKKWVICFSYVYLNNQVYQTFWSFPQNQSFKFKSFNFKSNSHIRDGTKIIRWRLHISGFSYFMCLMPSIFLKTTKRWRYVSSIFSYISDELCIFSIVAWSAFQPYSL